MQERTNIVSPAVQDEDKKLPLVQSLFGIQMLKSLRCALQAWAAPGETSALHCTSQGYRLAFASSIRSQTARRVQAASRRCEQTEEESTERTTEYGLKCNIAIDTNLLDQGLRLGLKDDREKTSSVTNQMALFKVELPHDLTCLGVLCSISAAGLLAGADVPCYPLN